MPLFYPLEGLNIKRARTVIFMTLILVSCTSQGPESQTGCSPRYTSTNVDYFFEKKTDYQLFFIRSLIKEEHLMQAQQQLAALPSKLNATFQCERLLLNAEFSFSSRQPQSAMSTLQKIDSACLDDLQRLRYNQIIIGIRQKKPSLDLVRAYINQEPLLQDGVAHQNNIDNTWKTLLSLSNQKSNLIIKPEENILKGWIDLLRVYLAHRQDPSLLQEAIKNWGKNRYPQNTASKMLPTQLSQIQNYQSSSVGNIALLLPVSGQEKVFTDAIKQGFTSAQNGITSPTSVEMRATVPSVQDMTDGRSSSCPVKPVDKNVPIKIYDTTRHSIPTLLAQAKQNGARMIIGPLLKNEVEQLYKIDSSLVGTINILALNQPDNLQPRPNICYLALAPEDEARDAANHIHQHGRKQPLLLLPRGSLGDRVATAFTDAWHHAGGGTVLAQRIGSTTELKQSLNRGVGIQLTGMPVTRSDQSTNIPAFKKHTGISPSGSDDGNIDAVYIIATPDELAFIKPMIDMNVSAHSRLALYASSRSYHAYSSPDYRLEMEGLEFSEIPLLTDTHPALLAQTSDQCRNNYSLVRLYAMGMDAWMLANHFNEIRHIPGFQVSGKTGELSVTPNCVIKRTLSWLKYQRGQLIATQ